MKKIIKLLLLFLAFSKTISAQFYGQRNYSIGIPSYTPLVNSVKKTNTFSNGYISGMYVPTNSYSKPFWIKKTNIHGLFASSDDFLVYYKLYKDNNCSQIQTNPTFCSGIDVIEASTSSTPTNGARYALTSIHSGTASGEFIVFATLNQNGSVVSSQFYDLPNGCTIGNYPSIVESISNPGSFYLAGSYDISGRIYTYVIHVKSSGNIIWSSNYSCGPRLAARDIIVSPYNNNEIILVGEAMPGNNQPPFFNVATQGFVLRLNANNGNIKQLINYGYDTQIYTKNQLFQCIEPRYQVINGSPGFIIGGSSDPINLQGNTGIGRAWICSIDTSGNLNSSTLLASAGSQIYSVIERLNPNNNQFEYYGSTYDSYPMVYKFDSNLNLFPTGMNRFEFNNNTFISNNGFNVLMTEENSGGSDDGFQVFCNDFTNLNMIYFIKSYFNGVSGCNENQLFDFYDSGPNQIYYPTCSQIGGYTTYSCQTFELFKSDINPNIQTLCASANVPNGSNLKPTSIESFSIQRNDYAYYDGVKIIIKSNARQQIQISQPDGKIIYSNIIEAGEFEISQEINISDGLYFIKFENNDIYKIVVFGR